MHLFAPNEDCLLRACEDVGISVDQLHRDVASIKAWMSQQSHLPAIKESLLVENMLLRCKGSVQETRKLLDFHLSMRAAAPEFFADRDPLSEEIQVVARHWTNVTLSQLTSEGYRVNLFIIPPKESLEEFQDASALKLWLMKDDIRLKEDISLGEVIVCDMRALSLSHLRRLTPGFMKKAHQCGFNGYKPRVKAMHLLNAPPLVDSLISLLKMVLPKKLTYRIHIHPDLESLHKHVDKTILPQDYGGDEKPMLELSSDWQKKVESFRDWFLEQDANGKVAESKRPQHSVNKSLEFFAFEGTFRKLEVD